jgi:collagen type XIV alpha
VDIGFLLDGSGSVGNQGFHRVLNFVNQVVSAFNISGETAQVGVTEFSNNPVIRIKLDDFQDSKLLQDEIIKIVDSGGRTRTDSALRIMSQEFFTYEKGSRAGVPKVLVVVTDGKSTGSEPLSEVVKGLRKKGVIIYSVGIGDRISMQELRDISRTKGDIFISKDFDSTGLIAPALVEKIVADLTGELKYLRPRCSI